MIIEAHDDHFPQGTEDRVWLAEVGKRGWTVLTKDQGIRYSPAELAAVRRARVQEFVLASGNLTSIQMADAFVTARPRMERLISTTAGSFIARVSKNGEISTLRKL